MILIGAGAFENKYNRDLMKIRIERLTSDEGIEVQNLMDTFHTGNLDNESFGRFGELMSKADSFLYQPKIKEQINLDIEIFQSVWNEASKLRETGELIHRAKNISCPVVAFHGDFDPHPIDGIEIPLSKRLSNFKMIRLERCGHTPWNEPYAKTRFFTEISNELFFVKHS